MMAPPNSIPVTVYHRGNDYHHGRSDKADYKGFLLSVTTDSEGVWAIVHDRDGFLQCHPINVVRLGHHPTPEAANDSSTEGATQ